MTDTEINTSIAEACGWKDRPDEYYDDHKAWTKDEGATWCATCDLPDFTHDLNAMHEAEKVLDQEKLNLYIDTLISLIHEVEPGYFCRVTWYHAEELTTSTALQRAEAFLRTIGKWKE